MLCLQVIMDFKSPEGSLFPVFLPQRSLVIMRGPSRYQFTHAITPRKSDIVPVDCVSVMSSAPTHETVAVGDASEKKGSKLTLVPRGVRTSFTFRKLRNPPQCQCGEFSPPCTWIELRYSSFNIGTCHYATFRRK